MSLHQDLLEQAKHLATRDRGRPKQASLRRAVSTAYYALFHLLVDEATRMLVSDPKLRPFVNRAFDHGEMKQASQAFLTARPHPDVVAMSGAIVPQDLKDVADAFVNAQLLRHDADYKTDRTFTRGKVMNFVKLIDQGLEAWARVRKQPIARVYLLSLLLWRKRR